MNLITPAAPLAAPAKVGVASHAWVGEDVPGEGEFLHFSGGARIDILEEREAGGWWKGRVDGKEGWFPSSYIIIAAAAPPAPAGGTGQPGRLRSVDVAADAWMAALDEVEMEEAAAPPRQTSAQVTEDAWLAALFDVENEGGEDIGEDADEEATVLAGMAAEEGEGEVAPMATGTVLADPIDPHGLGLTQACVEGAAASEPVKEEPVKRELEEGALVESNKKTRSTRPIFKPISDPPSPPPQLRPPLCRRIPSRPQIAFFSRSQFGYNCCSLGIA